MLKILAQNLHASLNCFCIYWKNTLNYDFHKNLNLNNARLYQHFKPPFSIYCNKKDYVVARVRTYVKWF